MRDDFAHANQLPRRTKRRPVLAPSEDAEQRILAEWLDFSGVLWCHVPNGGKRHVLVAKRMKAAGTKPGAPDCLIFTPPPTRPGCKGVAIELKRIKGGRVSDSQRAWLEALRSIGWYAFVALGADDAIKQLRMLGYGDA